MPGFSVLSREVRIVVPYATVYVLPSWLPSFSNHSLPAGIIPPKLLTLDPQSTEQWKNGLNIFSHKHSILETFQTQNVDIDFETVEKVAEKFNETVSGQNLFHTQHKIF